MDNKENEQCTKEESDLEFFVAFKKDGESFQNIMEKILLNKINKND